MVKRLHKTLTQVQYQERDLCYVKWTAHKHNRRKIVSEIKEIRQLKIFSHQKLRQAVNKFNSITK